MHHPYEFSYNLIILEYIHENGKDVNNFSLFWNCKFQSDTELVWYHIWEISDRQSRDLIGGLSVPALPGS